VLVGNFEKKRHQDRALRARQFYNNTLSLPIILRTKGSAKAPAVDLFRLKTLRGTKTSFLTPKRYNKHSHNFYKGVSPEHCLALALSTTQNQQSYK